MFTFSTSSVEFPLENIFSNSTFQLSPDISEHQHHLDPDLETFYQEALKAARSDRFVFLPEDNNNNRVKRGGGYGCSNSGLGIFNFLLFLVVLLGLLNTLMNNAMINIMINGQNVSLFQVDICQVHFPLTDKINILIFVRPCYWLFLEEDSTMSM